MKKMLISLCLASFVSAIAHGAVEYKVTKDFPVDTYSITKDVKIKNTKRFGMNFTPPNYSHWTSYITHNIWNRFGAFEPRVLPHWGMVEKGDGNSFICNNLTAWGNLKSGFWDGAEIHFFGIKDGKFEFKRKTKIIKSVSGKNIQDTYTLSNDGGEPIVAGDWFWLKKISLKPSPHQKTIHLLTGKEFNKHGIKNFDLTANMLGEPKWELVLDPCPENGSTASMKLTTTGFGGFYEGHTIQNNKNGWAQWNKGDYKWEGWFKRSSPGIVNVSIIGGKEGVEKSFEVGTTWKKFEFEFNPTTIFSQGKPTKYTISVPDACEFYLDNIMMYQKGIEPFEIYPKYLNYLKEYNPGCLRLEGGIGRRTIEAGLSSGINQVQEQDTTKGKYSARITQKTLVNELEMAKVVGTDPWIFIPGMTSLENCDNLMEYLGAPANKGYGKKRAAYGQENPWTDEFDVIYIEAGNEQWGRNFSHCFNRKPEIYGQMADMYFRRMKASPFYNPDKFKFVCNGWGNRGERGAWTEKVAKACPSADIIDVAFYFGGWDGVTIKGDSVNELYQGRMLGAVHIVENHLIRCLATNPDLGEGFAKILSEKPELQKNVLEAIVIPSVKGGGLGNSMKKVIRPIMLNPINYLTGTLFEKSEVAQELLKKCLDIKPTDKIDFYLPSLLQNSPKPTKKFIEKYPEILKAFAEKHNLNDEVKKAINDVAAGKKPAKPWTICNGVVPIIKSVIMPEFKTNQKLIADVSKEVEYIKSIDIKDEIIRQLFWEFYALIQTESAGIIAEIKAGEITLKEIANDKNIFADKAEIIAKKIASELKTQIDAYKSSAFDLDKLDDGNRQKILNDLIKVVQNDEITLARDSVLVVLETANAINSKDSSKIASLSNNKVFIENLRKRIVDYFADLVIETMENDSLIAEQIMVEYRKLPGNSAKGFKEFANYESGPGYQLPGPGVPVQEPEENFGKSLALGIPTIDAFMYQLEQGFGYQNYFKFAFGNYWSIYTGSDKEWRRNPSYEALLMVNNYTSGDLMFVDSSKVKRVTIPTLKISSIDNKGKAKSRMIEGRKNISWTKCYAFQDGKKHSFVLYNRSFTEPRTVKLNLPYSPSSQAVLHKLSANSPADTNRKELKVKQTEIKVNDFKNGYEVTLTPGEVLIINNNEK